MRFFNDLPHAGDGGETALVVEERDTFFESLLESASNLLKNNRKSTG